MEFDDIECKKSQFDLISNPLYNNILNQIYCSKEYKMLNVVDLFYRVFSQNGILILFFTVFVFPLMFLYIIQIMEKVITIIILKFNKRLKLSPLVSSFTLIPFANGIDSIFMSILQTDVQESKFSIYCYLLGGFIFSQCILLSVVAAKVSGEIKLPGVYILKDLGLVLVLVLTYFIISELQTPDYLVIILFIGFYFFYLVITIFLKKHQK